MNSKDDGLASGIKGDYFGVYLNTLCQKIQKICQLTSESGYSA